MGKRYRAVAINILILTVFNKCALLQYQESFICTGTPLDTLSGVKITSPTKSQKVPVGELKVTGTSENTTTDCQVYVDLNDKKSMQNTTAVGAGDKPITHIRLLHILTNII